MLREQNIIDRARAVGADARLVVTPGPPWRVVVEFKRGDLPPEMIGMAVAPTYQTAADDAITQALAHQRLR